MHLWNFHFILQYSLVECYEQEKKANVEFPITMQVKNQIIVEWQNIFVFVFFLKKKEKSIYILKQSKIRDHLPVSRSSRKTA